MSIRLSSFFFLLVSLNANGSERELVVSNKKPVLQNTKLVEAAAVSQELKQKKQGLKTQIKWVEEDKKTKAKENKKKLQELAVEQARIEGMQEAIRKFATTNYETINTVNPNSPTVNFTSINSEEMIDNTQKKTCCMCCILY